MKPDSLDEWLEASNPITSIDGCVETPEVTASVDQWKRLRGQQLRRRAWRRFALAASILFAIGGVAVSLTWNREADQSIVVAKIQPQERVAGEVRSHLPLAETPVELSSEPNLASKPVVDSNPVPSRAERELAEFGQFVQKAGPYLGKQWNHSAQQLMQMPATTQRRIIDWVPRLKTASQRHRAMMLVCQAAGDSQRGLLIGWLRTPSLREGAWSRLLDGASFEQLNELAALAVTPSQREQICQQVVLATHSKRTRNEATKMLVELAMKPDWRHASSTATKSMSSESIQELVLDLRARDSRTRTAIGFLLASIPGKEIDDYLSSLVLRGLYRQPAYLALLSRNTPDANAFLKHALTQPTLTPAFYSARTHFSNFEPELREWIQQTRGTFNEQTEINRTKHDRSMLAATKAFDQETNGMLVLVGKRGDFVRHFVSQQRLGSG